MKKVLCFGTFDKLHKGHEEFLKNAKEKGDYLIVIVISDDVVYENKKRYPLNNQEIRAKNLQEIKIVDKVIKVGDKLSSNLELIKSINPEVIVFGYDQKTGIEDKIVKYLNSFNLFPKIYRSKEFEEGVHSSSLKE